MNLLIKTIYLFIVIVLSKNILPNFVPNELERTGALCGIVFIANIIYRLFINHYYKRSDPLKTTVMEALTRTIFVIVGIVLTNYLVNNPEILEKYGIVIPEGDINVQTGITLLPFLVIKSLLSPDV